MNLMASRLLPLCCLRKTLLRPGLRKALLSQIFKQVHDDVGSPIKAIPFSDIPGPKSLPLIGTLWLYLPFFGKYQWDRLHRNGFKKLEEFGPIVREEMVPGVAVVWLFDPADVEHLFRIEGRFPCRRSHLALEKYRMDRPAVYKSGGLLPTNGPEWWRLRSSFQKDLSRLSSVRTYLPSANAVLLEFMTHIKDVYMGADLSTPACELERDFLGSISRLFLELTCLVAFDVRMGSLSSSDKDFDDTLPKKLIQAALDANSCILSTDNGPQLWRFFETPLYKKFRKSQEVMENVAVDLISQKKAEMQGSGPSERKSLLEVYLSTPGLDEKDIVGMAMDMLLAGIDTASYTTGFCLYHLAMNQDKQDLLHQEAVKLLPQKGVNSSGPVITEEILSKAQYVKAVLKESLRLNPVSVGVGRILPCDAVFSGFSVPEGTVVVTQNQISCRLEKYFSDPNSFVPERWIRGSCEHQQTPTHPFLLLPFGHGPRTCIARRLAEQNIHALLLHIAREFRVEWRGKPELDCVSLLINKPDQPLLFKFSRRDPQ